jgi:hypothetical protein
MISRVILDFDGTPEELSGDELSNYSGTKDFGSLTSLEALADTREVSLTALGEQFPSLEKFRLNNSIIPTVRDIGCAFLKLRFLWLPRCGLTSLDGITTIARILKSYIWPSIRFRTCRTLWGWKNSRSLTLKRTKSKIYPMCNS